MSTMKLWLQQGESDPFRAIIPQDYEFISDLKSLIHKDDFIKAELQIPKDCGSLTLFHNGVKLNPTLLLSNLGVIGTVGNPIIIHIRSSKETSQANLLNKAQSKWKQDPPFIYSVQKGLIFFANRSNAIDQLQKIHEAKYERALSSVGEEWIIPLVDNVVGLGKSEFGRHYIQKSRDLWKDLNQKSDFQKTLCGCHSVLITFTKGDLLKESFDIVMLNYLRDALEEMFNIPPAILSNLPITANGFLKEFTKLYGPVFIVLDEIGAAFEHKDLDIQQSRERFLLFCDEIVGKWLSLKNVFFLLLGRGSFLSYVGLRPTDINLFQSNYIFERLNIHLLRKDAIESIIKNTLLLDNGDKTLYQHFEMDDQQCSQVASHLFENTNGHPRSLVTAFKKCKSISELLAYNRPTDISNWKLFHENLYKNRHVVEELLLIMANDAKVDLTQTYVDPGKRSNTFDIIANNSFISWEGTVLNAKLYTHPFVKNYMANLLLPFRNYIEHVGSSNSKVSIDHSNVFEWIFLKRFQEIFSLKHEPGNILPLFFGSNVFGKLREVSFSHQTVQIPKITKKRKRDLNLTLESDTAHPDDWKFLMSLIDQLSDTCLKPRSKSSSSDAFLISNNVYQNNKLFKVTVGLAVKNFKSVSFGPLDLDKECGIFNRMFSGTDRQGRLNVLFICCTKYQDGFYKQFNGKLFHASKKDSFENIDEVILLDLTTAENREKFFDAKEFSVVIENVLKKVEVELIEEDTT